MSITSDANKALDVLQSIRHQLTTGSPGGTENLESDIRKLERVLKDPVFQENLNLQESLHDHVVNEDEQSQPTISQSPPATVGVAINRQLVAELKERFRRRLVKEKIPEVQKILSDGLPDFDLADRELNLVPVEIGRGHTDIGLTTVNTKERVIVIGVEEEALATRHGTVVAGDELLLIDTRLVAGHCAKTTNVCAILDDIVNGSENDPTTVILTFVHNQSFLDEQGNMVLHGDWTQVQIVELVNDGTGLGFGIVGGRSTGVVVKTILPSGPADKDGRLRPGDHLLQIGTVNLHGMSSQQVAMILRQQHSATVRLVVGRPTPSPAQLAEKSAGSKADIGAFNVLTKEALDPLSLDDHLSNRQQSSVDVPPPVYEQTTHKHIPEECESEIPDPEQKVYDTSPVKTESEQQEEQSETEMEEAPEPDHVSEEESTMEAEQDLESTDSLKTKLVAPAGQALDEIALATFCRVNWPPGQTESLQVELERDSTLGLGITVAGYVHRKEEISGVFVKNLVQGSSAQRNGKIRVHDLILEVNDKSLEGLSHSDSVRALVNSGTSVRLKLIRFSAGSPQALCLQMLREQETETQMIDIHKQEDQNHQLYAEQLSTTPPAQPSVSPSEEEIKSQSEERSRLTDEEIKERWKEIVGTDFDLIIGRLEKRIGTAGDGSLGLCLEGTVDVVNGAELRPHHYIQKIHPDGPAAKCGNLRPGDELLEVNGFQLFGVSHVDVMRTMTALPEDTEIRLVVARPTQVPPPANVFMPRTEQPQSSSYYSVLSPTEDRIHKAKSEVSLSQFSHDTYDVFAQSVKGWMRSRSLELLYGMAVWSISPTVIELEKANRGLGFSVLDYQDPLHPAETVIVIKSLVPGGPAHMDGRLLPGDRLLYLNDVDLTNASLDTAVQALKSAPKGPVVIGVAKPLPLHDEEHVNRWSHAHHSPIISRSERLLAKSSVSSPQPKRKRIAKEIAGASDPYIPQVPPGDWSAEARRRLYPQAYYPSAFESDTLHQPSISGSTLSGSHLSMFSWSPVSTPSLSPAGSPSLLRGSWASDVIRLPTSLEKSIKIHKGSDHLGVTLEPVEKAVNGCQIEKIHRNGALFKEGTLQVGDLITKINNENLRRVTNSQARAILKRTNLIGADCSITYIPVNEAERYKERSSNEPADPVLQPINRLSPNSPYFSRKEIVPSDGLSLADTEDLSTSAGFDLATTAEAALSRDQSEEISALIACPVTVAETVAHSVTQSALDGSMSDLAFAYIVPEWSQTVPTQELSEEKDDQSMHIELSSPDEEWPPPPPLSPLADSPPTLPSPERAPSPELIELVDANEITAGATIVTVDPDQNNIQEITGTTSIQIGEEPEPPVDLFEFYPPLESEEVILVENIEDTVQDITVENTVPDTVQDTVPPEELIDEIAQNVQVESQPALEESTQQIIETPEKSPLVERISTESKQTMSRESSTASETASLFAGGVQHQTVGVSKSKFWGEARTVELLREPNKSFGISIVGGRVEVSQKGGLPGTGNTVSGIFIKSVLAESPAGKSGQMNMGDRVISVNDVDLRDATHEQAVEVIRNASNPVVFVVQSIHSFSPHQMISSPNASVGSSSSATAVLINPETAIPPQPEVSSETPVEVPPESQNENQETPGTIAAEVTVEPVPVSIPKTKGKTMRNTENGHADSRQRVDSRSAAAMPWDENDTEGEEEFGYTTKKIHTKYGELKGELFFVRFRRTADGLGLSLAGNRDRGKLSVFVVAIKGDSPVITASNQLRVGDELLEINGSVLYGRSHLNASAIIRSIRDPVIKLVVLRRSDAFDEMAVRPLDSMSRSPSAPVTPMYSSGMDKSDSKSSDETKSEELPSQRTVCVQRGETGFGITLTEGTTTENLRGIFVTNISPNSPTAQERQLRIGDQVLAVNGQPVVDWSSGQVAETMQNSEEKEIQLTVTTHAIVPVPASGPPATPQAQDDDTNPTKLNIGEVIAERRSSQPHSITVVEVGEEEAQELEPLLTQSPDEEEDTWPMSTLPYMVLATQNEVQEEMLTQVEIHSEVDLKTEATSSVENEIEGEMTITDVPVPVQSIVCPSVTLTQSEDIIPEETLLENVEFTEQMPEIDSITVIEHKVVSGGVMPLETTVMGGTHGGATTDDHSAETVIPMETTVAEGTPEVPGADSSEDHGAEAVISMETTVAEGTAEVPGADTTENHGAEAVLLVETAVDDAAEVHGGATTDDHGAEAVIPMETTVAEGTAEVLGTDTTDDHGADALLPMEPAVEGTPEVHGGATTDDNGAEAVLPMGTTVAEGTAETLGADTTEDHGAEAVLLVEPTVDDTAEVHGGATTDDHGAEVLLPMEPAMEGSPEIYGGATADDHGVAVVLKVETTVIEDTAEVHGDATTDDHGTAVVLSMEPALECTPEIHGGAATDDHGDAAALPVETTVIEDIAEVHAGATTDDHGESAVLLVEDRSFTSPLPTERQPTPPADTMAAPTEDQPRRPSLLSRQEQLPTARKKSSASSGPNPATVTIEPGTETLIEIDKGGQGLGLSIVGGSDTVLSTVVIHEVYPDGAAAKDGRLKPGDQVLEVNNQSLRDVTHSTAISVLRQTPSKVRLLIYRDLNLQLSLLDPTQIYNIFDFELTKKPGKGLGLSIVGRKSEPGVYVSEVVKGGTAEADGRLMQGDQILAVNGNDVTTAMQEEVAAILKTCMGKVSIKVGRWKLSSGTSKPSQLAQKRPSNDSESSGSVHRAKPVTFDVGDTPTKENAAVTPSTPPSTVTSDSTAPAVPQVQVTVEEPSQELVSSKSFDLSPVMEEKDISAAVADTNKVPAEPAPVKPESPVGDDQKPSTSATTPTPEPQIRLIETLQEESTDSMLIELNKIPSQQLGMGIGKRTRGILVTSLQAGSIAAAKLKVGDRIMAVNGQTVTDQQSAVNYVRATGLKLVLQVARPKEEPQHTKPTHDVCLDRGPGGFGFSIVGGADSATGNMPIYIRDIQKEGMADRQGELSAGDEILSVDGQSIIGMSHSEAVEVLRKAKRHIHLTVALVASRTKEQ